MTRTIITQWLLYLFRSIRIIYFVRSVGIFVHEARVRVSPSRHDSWGIDSTGINKYKVHRPSNSQ